MDKDDVLTAQITELSLFTGAGGGSLASKYFLGWRCVGYVEWNEYCCEVIARRIRNGFLDEAPVFNMDVEEFNEKCAGMYRGVVDVVSAGFPCQPFSTAGKRQGDEDEKGRNLWPATLDSICRIQPKRAFLENVPGLLSHEYIREIFGDLAEIGYNARWTVLGADEVDAPHKRQRLWIMADRDVCRALR